MGERYLRGNTEIKLFLMKTLTKHIHLWYLINNQKVMKYMGLNKYRHGDCIWGTWFHCQGFWKYKKVERCAHTHFPKVLIYRSQVIFLVLVLFSFLGPHLAILSSYSCAQEELWVVCRGPYEMPRIKPGPGTCKLSTLLLLWFKLFSKEMYNKLCSWKRQWREERVGRSPPHRNHASCTYHPELMLFHWPSFTT